LFLGRAHVSKDEAVALFDRIPGLARNIAMKAMLGLAGLIETGAVDAEQPAVIAAADAFILDLAVEQGGAAMHAARIEETWPALTVTEQNQILAQEADFCRPRGGVARQRDRMPKTPQPFAARRVGAHLGQHRIVSRVLPAIGRAFEP